MKLIFEITVEQFNQYKQHVIDTIATDFYTLADTDPEFYKIHHFGRQQIYYPFRNKMMYGKMYAYLDDLNQHSYIDKDTKTITLTRGYMIDDGRELYSYSTHGGNVWGVGYYNDNPCLFYFGTKKMLVRMPLLDELYTQKAEPILFIRNPMPKKPWYQYGLLPQYFNRGKAVAYFRHKNLKTLLKSYEQVVWDKWFDDLSVTEAVLG